MGLTARPNFITLICQAFEYLVAGDGRPAVRTSGPTPAGASSALPPVVVNEEYLNSLCKHLKLPTEQQVCLFLALAHAAHPTMSAESVKALMTKVPELAPGACAPLPPVALHALLNIVTSHAVFAAVPKAQSQCLAALKALHPHAASSLFLVPVTLVATPTVVDIAQCVVDFFPRLLRAAHVCLCVQTRTGCSTICQPVLVHPRES